MYLQKNKLKQIPASLFSLPLLNTLNLASNSLRDLPASVAGLVNLQTLDLRDNPKLKRLPKVGH